MTKLKNLKGTAIQFLDADPVEYVGSWASGGNLNDSRRYFAGIGSSTAGLVFGGEAPAQVTSTEQYNGTSWTEVNNLNAAQIAQGSAGTLTSGMSALGALGPGSNVEDWNGSTWAANPHSLNSARQFAGGDGASNDSAIMVGGEPAPNGALTEIYNGSTWSESGDLNTARNQLAATGTVTALIAMGGNTGADAETFNGTSWTAVSDMNSGRGGLCGSGTSTLALAFAGNPDIAKTENWNGSAWTEVNDLSTGREFGAGSNITGNTSAFMAGGYTTTYVANTEEWSFPAITAKNLQEGDMWFNSTSSTLKGYGTAAGIPLTTWSSGGTPNAARSARGGAGPNTATIHFGGFNPTSTVNNETETYNGTAWTEVANLNTATAMFCPAQQGTQTAALAASGTTGGSDTTNTESWNGSSWSELSELNSSHSYAAGAGTQTAAITAGGQPPTRALTEVWDGTSWTEVSDLNTGRYFTAASGFQTAALCFSGDTVPNAFTNKTESWDGTTWSEVNDLNTTRATGGGFGTQTTALMCTGNTYPPIVANVESWNGSSWSEINDVATGRIRIASSGSSGAAGLIGGGQTPPIVGNVEEFTATAAVATVTTS